VYDYCGSTGVSFSATDAVFADLSVKSGASAPSIMTAETLPTVTALNVNPTASTTSKLTTTKPKVGAAADSNSAAVQVDEVGISVGLGATALVAILAGVVVLFIRRRTTMTTRV
jgi:hypothetical protein